MLVSVLLVIITAAFGRAFYSADIPTGVTLLRMLVMLAVGAAAFCALGFAISAVIPNADASLPIVNAVILPLLFLSGVPLGTPNRLRHGPGIWSGPVIARLGWASSSPPKAFPIAPGVREYAHAHIAVWASNMHDHRL